MAEREGDAVLGVLRSEIQHLDIPCFFAGSARESFRGMFMSETSPFFESARLLEIGPIPSEDFQKFLREQFARGGRRVTPEASSLLLAVGGESPNDGLCYAST